MKKIQGLAVSNILFVTLSIGLILAEVAHAQIPTFTGKFTLGTQVRWSSTVLRPGDYTISFESISTPATALIRDSSGRPVGFVMSVIDSGQTSTENALLIKEKDGQLRVYALELAGLKRMLVYDPVLARRATTEARVPQRVPVMLAQQP